MCPNLRGARVTFLSLSPSTSFPNLSSYSLLRTCPPLSCGAAFICPSLAEKLAGVLMLESYHAVLSRLRTRCHGKQWRSLEFRLWFSADFFRILYFWAPSCPPLHTSVLEEVVICLFSTTRCARTPVFRDYACPWRQMRLPSRVCVINHLYPSPCSRRRHVFPPALGFKNAVFQARCWCRRCIAYALVMFPSYRVDRATW